MYLLWEIFFISITIALPIFSQRTAYQSIDEDYFKKYKIKKFGFLFKGMQGQHACSHGVILPMLIIQIQGYVLGLAQLIFILISKSISFSDKYAIIVVILTFIVHLFSVCITTVITGIISKIREKAHHKKEKSSSAYACIIYDKKEKTTHTILIPKSNSTNAEIKSYEQLADLQKRKQGKSLKE